MKTLSAIEAAIRQTSFGAWVIKEDTHFTKWIEEEGRLDHHVGFVNDLLPFIPSGGVAMDIGAYIGDHTIAYANKAGPAGTVYAFEPNPIAYTCLRRNCPSVRSFMLGVGAAPGSSAYVEIDGNFGAGHLARGADDGAPVPIIDIDSLHIDRLHYVKIDVEGFENFALDGMSKTIARLKPVLCVEVTAGHQEAQGSTAEHLLRKITEMGYVLRRFYDHAWDDPQFDVLAVPTEAVGNLDIQKIDTATLGSMVNEFRQKLRD